MRLVYKYGYKKGHGRILETVSRELESKATPETVFDGPNVSRDLQGMVCRASGAIDTQLAGRIQALLRLMTNLEVSGMLMLGWLDE